jgi:hypothetical protein
LCVCVFVCVMLARRLARDLVLRLGVWGMVRVRGEGGLGWYSRRPAMPLPLPVVRTERGGWWEEEEEEVEEETASRVCVCEWLLPLLVGPWV